MWRGRQVVQVVSIETEVGSMSLSQCSREEGVKVQRVAKSYREYMSREKSSAGEIAKQECREEKAGERMKERTEKKTKRGEAKSIERAVQCMSCSEDMPKPHAHKRERE